MSGPRHDQLDRRRALLAFIFSDRSEGRTILYASKAKSTTTHDSGIEARTCDEGSTEIQNWKIARTSCIGSRSSGAASNQI